MLDLNFDFEIPDFPDDPHDIPPAAHPKKADAAHAMNLDSKRADEASAFVLPAFDFDIPEFPDLPLPLHDDNPKTYFPTEFKRKVDEPSAPGLAQPDFDFGLPDFPADLPSFHLDMPPLPPAPPVNACQVVPNFELPDFDDILIAPPASGTTTAEAKTNADQDSAAETNLKVVDTATLPDFPVDLPDYHPAPVTAISALPATPLLPSNHGDFFSSKLCV